MCRRADLVAVQRVGDGSPSCRGRNLDLRSDNALGKLGVAGPVPVRNSQGECCGNISAAGRGWVCLRDCLGVLPDLFLIHL